ncbi:flagellar hook capping protein, Fjo24 [Nonlabens spongiae]|uniref:Flagellar hook capping protein, Fjo24 n=1 Tax=Nonlabens spongiae TaxID=331648 RepID=A0A1W6MLL6_9FLAO|nr:type IX secretion system sortase PorU [Nonlabens spongiae]ARN78406.1 flagellar hook capping protein, Fjo24 [Nonlabens spongiae]
MRSYLVLISLLSSLYICAQNGTVRLDWTEAKSYTIGSNTTVVPGFRNGMIFNGETLEFSKVIEKGGLVDPSTFEVKNVQSERIIKSELRDLALNNIPSSLQISVRNTLSRKRNYKIITATPIYKDGNSYRRLLSFDYSYEALLQTKNFKRGGEYGNSVLAIGEWYRVRVTETGVQRMTRSFLSNLGIDVGSLDPRRIKVYGHGGTSLSLINGEDQFFDPPELAIRVIGEEDGNFDSGDAVLFYGTATDSEYVSENDSFINPYTDESYYYINIQGAEGKRISNSPLPSANAVASYDYYHSRKHHEIDQVNYGQLGRRWVGESFGFEPEQSFTFNAENVVAEQPTRARVAFAAVSDVTTSFSSNLNGQAIGSGNLLGLRNLNGSSRNIAGSHTVVVNNNLTTSNGELTVEVSYENNGNPSSRAYLDYIWLDVPQRLDGSLGQFQFRNLDVASSAGPVEFEITNAAVINEIWDITDRWNITTYPNNDAESNFIIKVDPESQNLFHTVANNDFITPSVPADARVSNSNLKGTIFLDRNGDFKDLDYIIVTPSFLRSEAQRLANYHIENNNLNTKVVLLSDIYREFSEGVQDIAAIRNFIKYIYDNASDPSRRVRYLNMFGDASFDYKNRITIRDNIVPTFLSSNSSSLVSSYCTDDFFVMMDDGEGRLSNSLMDLAVGRMIVSNQTEAREMVDKIVRYTSEPAFDAWRNRVTLIGDDVDESGDAILQVNVNELGDEITRNRPVYNVQKILLDSYDQVSSAGGPRYPDAVEDIENAFELGSLVINYFGHGNEDGLAREFIITQSGVEDYRHPDRLPLMIAVTCDFSRYDNPLRVSGGEKLYLNPRGGSIGTVATNRLIFISTGAGLNQVLDEYLFAYDNVEPVSMAEALRLAKVDPSLASDSNKRVIAFIGDPALKIALPKPEIVLTTINGNPIDSNTDVLQALANVTLGGEVRGLDGNRIQNYQGIANITLFDKAIDRETLANDNIRDDAGDLIKIDFEQQGEVLFRGQATVEDGSFEVSFVMPRDTQIPVGNGRVSFYAKRNNVAEDQNGFSQDILIGGIDRNAPEDNVGPEIQLYMNDTNFVNGGITDDSPFLLALLNDDNGINTSSGIGHDITGVLDGDDANPFILNDYYEAAVDDFTSGQVYFPLRDIEPGLHTLTVKAWDTHNNSVESDIQFVVSESEGVELTKVLNYPNPFNNYTEFWFNHNRPFEPLDVQVQVMTISGKVVWSTVQNVTTTGFTSREITWDGRDDFGQRLGKGVYVYKIHVKSTLTNQSASKIEKLVIL